MFRSLIAALFGFCWIKSFEMVEIVRMYDQSDCKI